MQLFGDLIQRSYITQLERYSGEPIRFVGKRVEGDLGVVSTRFVTKQSEEIPVDYRLLSRDGRWRVYDVVVEGVNLVGTYRSQFDKVIRTSSYPELVKRLKDKEAATRYSSAGSPKPRPWRAVLGSAHPPTPASPRLAL